MANLVPLNIDKETGKIVARGRPFGGGSPGGAGQGTGYLFEQIVDSDVWNIPHGQENDRVVIQVYDEVGEFTLPQSIVIVDLNNIRITFGAPMGGTAHMWFFQSQ